MRRALPLGLVLFLTAALLARTLGVGHLSDDWIILDHVSHFGNEAAWTGPWMDAEGMRFHRPVFTALYDLEYRMFGTDPLPGHIHHILWHLAATALVYALARSLGGGVATAVFASLLFGCHPQIAAATGWLAARCGTVAGTLTLAATVAWVRGMRGRLWFWSPLALLAGAAAALTRESGYLALIIPLVLDLLLSETRPARGRLLLRHLPFAAAGIALLGLRFEALKTLGGGYPTPSGLMGGFEAAGETLRTFGSAVGELFRGIPADFVPDEVGGKAPKGLREWVGVPAAWPTLAAGVLLLLLLVTLSFRVWVGAGEKKTAPPRVLRTVLALLGVQALLLLITGPELAPATGQRWYAGIAYFCVFVGLALAPMMRMPLVIIPFILVGSYGFGHWWVQSEVVDADRDAKAVIEKLHTHLSEDHRNGITTAFITNLPESRKGIPLFHWGVASALRPPFHDALKGMQVYPVHHFMGLESTRWAFHAPVEALLYARGGNFMIYRLSEHPTGEKPPEVTRASAENLQPLFGRPEEAEKRLQGFFTQPPLKVLEQSGLADDVSSRLRIRLATENLHAVTFHCFLPTADAQVFERITGPETTVDLQEKLVDYIRFHREAFTLYVVPIGERNVDGRTTFHLGPLLAYDFPSRR